MTTNPGVRVKEIFGSGPMAELTRQLDWTRTSVGSIERWPDALLLTVNILLASPHPMLLWWGEDLVQFYNDAYSRTIPEGKHPRALGSRAKETWPEIWSAIGPQIEKVMLNGESTWKEDQLFPRYRSGKFADAYWTYSYSAVRDLHGNICGTLATCIETTSTTAEKNSLQRQVKLLSDLFHQAPAFFASLRGPLHVFEMTNPLYEQLVGSRNLIGKTVREAVPEVEEQGFIAILDEVYRTGVPFIGRNTVIKLARGGSEVLEERKLDFVYQPTREEDGSVSGIIALGVDVTEAKRAEQVLFQTEKLAAVGRLASSIAHEINNPLESVTNLLYLARFTAKDPQTISYLDAAEIELRRVAAIANQTLRFHRQTSRPKATTSEDLLGSTLSIYQGRLINSRIQVSRRERAADPIQCFDGEIRQVLSNLVGNAIDAMGPAKGRLLIRSRNGTDWSTGRRGLIFTVADTGTGMSRDTAAKIFDAFFTTKEQSGTGLGLWVSREIIERHRGHLAVKTCQKEGRSGTVFTVFLPFEAASRSLPEDGLSGK